MPLRLIADSLGTGATPLRTKSNRNRRGPQYGLDLRASNTTPATCAGI